MSRNSLTQAEKAEWLELFENYDQSAAAFCREFSLPYSSFRKWRREASDSEAKHGRRLEGAPKFVELVTEQPREDCRKSPGAWGRGEVESVRVDAVLAELDLGAGYVLRVYRTKGQDR